MLYTALSHATRIEDIHVGKCADFYRPQKYHHKCHRLKMYQNEYTEGKLYEIKIGEYYYIGETTKSIEERLQEHIKDPNSLVFKQMEITKEEPVIRLIADVPCFDHETLMSYETNQIQLYQRQYGDRLLNKKQLIKKKEKKEKKDIVVKICSSKIVEKRFRIVNDEKKQTLRCQYRDVNGKKKEISKKYTNPLDFGVEMHEMQEKVKQAEEEYRRAFE